MSNQTILSVSLPLSMNGQIYRRPQEANQQVVRQQEADVVFVPELWAAPAAHLRSFTTFLNVPKRLSDWLFSTVSGAVSV